MSGEVRVDLAGRVARVTLSHNGKLNAMSRNMWRALRDQFAALQGRDDVRCVVLQGEDGNFCAGGDISEYPDFRYDETALREFHELDVWGGLQAVLDCDLPVIALIQGACMGAGVELASCCDIRIAGATAQFGAPIARLGFPMAPREVALVSSAAGLLTARELLLSAATLDAAEMRSRGFLNRVVSDDKVAQEVADMAQRVTTLAPQAARLNKQTLRTIASAVGLSAPAPDSIDHLLANAYSYASGAEHREGISAFLEKRKPAF
jgi:enoyl-CoA hydratase